MIESIEKAFTDAPKRGWSSVYFFFDIHGTVLVADYNNTTINYYPYAKEVLQLLTYCSEMPGYPKIVLGIYSCSHPDEIERYQEVFKADGIDFKYVNENPEVGNTRLGCFTTKPYFNCLFEDKANFKPDTWFDILEYMVDIWELWNLARTNEHTTMGEYYKAIVMMCKEKFSKC